MRPSCCQCWCGFGRKTRRSQREAAALGLAKSRRAVSPKWGRKPPSSPHSLRIRSIRSDAIMRRDTVIRLYKALSEEEQRIFQRGQRQIVRWR